MDLESEESSLNSSSVLYKLDDTWHFCIRQGECHQALTQGEVRGSKCMLAWILFSSWSVWLLEHELRSLIKVAVTLGPTTCWRCELEQDR